MRYLIGFGGAACLLLFSVACGDEAGSAPRGKAFATQLCAGCHAIEKGGASPNSLAPPFDRAATLDKYTDESFANWLGTRHPAINGIAIKPSIAGDLLAYIRSLGAAKQQASRN